MKRSTPSAIGRPAWRIETRTGDAEPQPEWLALRGWGKRYQYVEREEAERVLAQLQRIQPHAQFRIAPM
jgi:hypothetical protein